MVKKTEVRKIFTITICCSKCKTRLYKYNKYGSGSLVKCYLDRIVKDYTNGNLQCPKCNTLFARRTRMSCRDVNKIIQGKVYIKGHIKKS